MNIAFDCELPFQLIHFWWPRLKKCLTDHLWLIISMSGNFKMPKILKFVLQWTLLAELAKPALTTYWCSCEILFINKQVRKLYRKFCSNYWSSGTTKEVKLSVLHMNYKKKKKENKTADADRKCVQRWNWKFSSFKTHNNWKKSSQLHHLVKGQNKKKSENLGIFWKNPQPPKFLLPNKTLAEHKVEFHSPRNKTQQTL